MQKIMRSSIPPNKNITTPANHTQNESPAFLLALRIKNEQGTIKAAEFLLAMEPYLAPMERMHISNRLGLPNVQKPVQNTAQKTAAPNFTMPQNNGFNMPNMGSMNPLSLINMLSGMNSMQKNASNSMDPAMISKLMSIMSKK